jgi:hypothetical protein
MIEWKIKKSRKFAKEIYLWLTDIPIILKFPLIYLPESSINISFCSTEKDEYLEFLERTKNV